MRKETAWAIGIGIIFGIIIAFGIWRINISMRNDKNNAQVQKTATPLTPAPTQNTKITIQMPLNNQVLNKNLTTISGISKPNSKIVIATNTDDFYLISDPQGKFEQEVELENGINNIEAFAVSETPESSSITLIYSSLIEDENATSYLGIVTDVTGSSIQLKSTTNEIKQIAVSENTSVSNIRDTPDKIAKLTDVAIGDFIVGLGQASGSSVLSTSRILITNPITNTKVNVITAKFDKKELKTDKNTIYYEVKDGEIKKIKSTAVKAGIDIVYTEVGEIVRTVFVTSN